MTETQKITKDLKRVASIFHQTICHWLEYQQKSASILETGEMLLPSDKVERWNRQRKTEYEDLSEQEKNSDREIARKFLEKIQSILFESNCVQKMQQKALQEEQFEVIASLEHENWNHWMEYIFDVGRMQEDGSFKLDKTIIEQMQIIHDKPLEQLPGAFQTFFIEQVKLWMQTIEECGLEEQLK